MARLYRADFHVHTKFIEDYFTIQSSRSKLAYLLKSYWKTILKGIFVKRAVYKKLRPKSDLAILDALRIPESSLDPEEAVNCALSNHMTFVPITNHNDVEAAIFLNKKFPGRVLIGEEVSVMLDKKRIMHILVYFLNYSKGELRYSSSDLNRIREMHSRIQEYRENLQALALYLKKQDNVFIGCAHPFSKTAFSRFIFTKGKEIDRELIKLMKENLDFIEVFNGSYSEIENSLAREFAIKHNIGFSAGSDAHETINDLKKGIISMPGATYVEAEARSIKGLFAKMKKRQVKIVGVKYRLEKVKWLLAEKYFIHWTHIKSKIDRAIKPLIHLVFLYAITSHYAGYRNKLKVLAKKLDLNYRRHFREEEK